MSACEAERSELLKAMFLFIDKLIIKYPDLKPLHSKFCKTTDYIFITVIATIPEINKIAKAPEHEAQQITYDMIDKMLMTEGIDALHTYDKADISKLCTFIEYFADIAVFG
jgi:hypothetical protein